MRARPTSTVINDGFLGGHFHDLFKNPDFRIYSNAQEVARLLDGQPYRKAENGLRKGLRAAANVVLHRARELVPVDTSALQKALGVAVSSIPGGAYARIGVVKDQRWIFHKLRGVQGRNGRAKLLLGRKLKKSEFKDVPKKIVKRPVLYAPKIERNTPYLRPALLEKKQAVSNVLLQIVRNEMRKPWGKPSKRIWRTEPV